MKNAARILAFTCMLSFSLSPVSAAEHSWRDFKDVSNTSFTEPDGEKGPVDWDARSAKDKSAEASHVVKGTQ